MSTSPDVSSLTKGLLDDELIDLEPSLELEVARHLSRATPSMGVGLVRGLREPRSRDPLAPPPSPGLGRAFSDRRLRRSCSSGASSTDRPITGW